MPGKNNKQKTDKIKKIDAADDDSEDRDDFEASPSEEETDSIHDPLKKTAYQKFNFKADTFPEIFPLGFFQQQDHDQKQNQSMEGLKEQIKIMNEELQREFENNKVTASNKILEEKCEEYLTQLQRSAAIIESTRSNNQTLVEALETRIETLQAALQQSQQRLEIAEQDNKRITEDSSELLIIAKHESAENARSKDLLDEKDKALQDLGRKYR